MSKRSRKQILVPNPLSPTEPEPFIVQLKAELMAIPKEEQETYQLPKDIPLYSLKVGDFPEDELAIFRERIRKAVNSENHRKKEQIIKQKLKEDFENTNEDLRKTKEDLEKTKEELREAKKRIKTLEALLSDKDMKIMDQENQLGSQALMVDSTSDWYNNNDGSVYLENLDSSEGGSRSSGNSGSISNQVESKQQPSSWFISSNGDSSLNQQAKPSTVSTSVAATGIKQDISLWLNSQDSTQQSSIVSKGSSTNKFRNDSVLSNLSLSALENIVNEVEKEKNHFQMEREPSIDISENDKRDTTFQEFDYNTGGNELENSNQGLTELSGTLFEEDDGDYDDDNIMDTD